MTAPFWMTAFLDFAPDEHDEGLALWERLTGYTRTGTRGEHEEFVSLIPPDGDGFLRVQRLGDGPSRIHLDVHVPDPARMAGVLVGIGARIVEDHGDYVALHSPGGFPFCLVSHPAAQRPAPTPWPGGHSSYVDQVCLDIPPSAYDREFDFWHRLTGWERRDRKEDSEFGRLNPPRNFPVQLLLQRLDDDRAMGAHLDWAATDRDAETARHVEAGSEQRKRFEGWTVMRGPAGMTYCITRRSPETKVPG